MIDVSYRSVPTAKVSTSSFCDSARLFLRLVLALMLLTALGQARAEEPDDQYMRIYTLIQDADSLGGSGSAASALAKYRAALAGLQGFQKEHPDWNAKVVAFRIRYVAGKIAELSGNGATTNTAPSISAPPKAVRPPAKTATTTPSLSSGAQLKLLEAGAEPRQVLRFHPKAGDKHTTEMLIKMGMEMKMGETQMPATKLPGMKLILDNTVKSVAPDGAATFDTVMREVGLTDEAEVMPQVAEAMKSALGSMKGVSGTMVVSDRGFNKGLEMKVPAGADPQMRQMIDQMKDTFSNLTAPLPEEAVGPGARWEVRLPLKSQGLTMEQTTTYKLLSLEGEHLTTRNAIVQRAPSQKIQNPAMPGLKLDLDKMSGTGTSDTTFDLAQTLPVTATGNVHSELSMSMNQGGQKQPMNMKVDVNVRIETK
jgi:hypothetical protein